MVDTTIIKLLCKKLPGDLSNAVYNEYVGRWEDIENIWEYPHNRFKALQGYKTTIQCFWQLALFIGKYQAVCLWILILQFSQ